REGELRNAIPGHLERVPVGGQPPLVSGDQGGRKRLEAGKASVRRELEEARLRGIVGPEEEQPSCLPGVGAVDPHDWTTAAARQRAQRDFRVLLCGRRDAPDAGDVVTWVDADGETARLLEPGIARQRIPAV